MHIRQTTVLIIYKYLDISMACNGLPWWLSSKESACNARDMRDAVSIPVWGRSPGEGNGKPLQYSCLESPMNRGTWQATVHRVTKSRTWLNNWAYTQIASNWHRFPTNENRFQFSVLLCLDSLEHHSYQPNSHRASVQLPVSQTSGF